MSSPKIITAGDHGADALEVYDARTGEIQRLVKTIAVGHWIDKYEQLPSKDGILSLAWENGGIRTTRVQGDFRVRQKRPA